MEQRTSPRSIHVAARERTIEIPTCQQNLSNRLHTQLHPTCEFPFSARYPIALKAPVAEPIIAAASWTFKNNVYY